MSTLHTYTYHTCRYDKLIDTMSAGESSIPAVGFGFGDAVIVELLKMKNLLPDLSVNKIDVLVYYMAAVTPKNDLSDATSASTSVAETEKLNLLLQTKAIIATSNLRKAGLVTELVMEEKKAKWAFQRADKLKAGKCIYIYARIYIYIYMHYYYFIVMNTYVFVVSGICTLLSYMCVISY